MKNWKELVATVFRWESVQSCFFFLISCCILFARVSFAILWSMCASVSLTLYANSIFYFFFLNKMSSMCFGKSIWLKHQKWPLYLSEWQLFRINCQEKAFMSLSDISNFENNLFSSLFILFQLFTFIIQGLHLIVSLCSSILHSLYLHLLLNYQMFKQV